MNKKRLHNKFNSKQAGQLMVEAVLLLTLVVFLWAGFSKFVKRQQWFDSLVNGPWQSISGMIESGVWKQPSVARNKHPNNFNRMVSLKED